MTAVERAARYEWVWTEADSAASVVVALLVAVAGIAATWWLYRAERRRWQRWSGRCALALRASLWLGLGLLLLGPAWVRVEREEIEDFGIHRLAVVSRGRSVEIASCLGPDQKGVFADRLTRALIEARRGPRFSD